MPPTIVVYSSCDPVGSSFATKMSYSPSICTGPPPGVGKFVELVTPVEDPALCEELDKIFEFQLEDRRSVWDMKPDGSYVQRQAGRGRSGKGCQLVLIEEAAKRHAEANRLRRRKPRAIARRAIR